MYYVRLKVAGTAKNVLCMDRKELVKETSRPGAETDLVIDFTIHGKEYRTRKADCEYIAILWSNEADTTGLYMSDMYHIADWFYRNGKRYGLLADFIENGLC